MSIWKWLLVPSSAVISPSAVADARLAGRSGWDRVSCPPGTGEVQPALLSGDCQCHPVTPRLAVGQRQSTCLLGPGPAAVRERLHGAVTSRVRGPGIYGKPSPRLLGRRMRMPASLAAFWGSTAFWVQQLGLWPCRTPPLGLGTVSLLLPWALGGCAVTSDPVRSEGRAGPSGWAQSPRTRKPG